MRRGDGAAVGELPSLKVLVVGDSGVGKSSLVHLITQGAPLTAAAWTVGCSVDVAMMESSDTFVEYWDVGGNPKYAESRSMFYRDVDGLIMVHDLSNTKSYENLRRWHSELHSGGIADDSGADPEGLVGTSQWPTLIVGTKTDLAGSGSGRGGAASAASSRCSLSGDLMASSLNLNCLDPKALAARGPNRAELDGFLERVTARKLGGAGGRGGGRARKNAGGSGGGYDGGALSGGFSGGFSSGFDS